MNALIKKKALTATLVLVSNFNVVVAGVAVADVLQINTGNQYVWGLNTYQGSGGLGLKGLSLDSKTRNVMLATVMVCAEKYDNLSWQMLDSLIKAESAYNVDAVSPKGAIGLTQLMPGTAASLGVDPYNRLDNVCGGAKYLSALKNEFKTWELALAAYNAGPGAVKNNGYRVPPYAETRAYVKKVLADFGKLGNNP